MADSTKNKGPFNHRLLAGVFTLLLSLLVFWLLDFAIEDIGTIPGQRYEDVEKKFLSADLLHQQEVISGKINEAERNITAQQERQRLLRDSTVSHETTLKQLLEIQRINSQKGVYTAEAQQKALAESANLFLANQQKDQALSMDIAKLTEQHRQLQDEKRAVDTKLDEERKPAQEEFVKLEVKHNRYIALLKLVLLIPLLSGALFIIVRKRAGMYAPLVYACSIAIFAQTVLVIHQHFPTRYFKYILLSAAILIVVYILSWLIKMVNRPKLDWLLNQYRGAYEKFFCPVCDYPIRRGPRRYLFWTRQNLSKINFPTNPAQENDHSYSCPACGSQLYEACVKCKGIRHSLLPYCENCGAEKVIDAPATT